MYHRFSSLLYVVFVSYFLAKGFHANCFTTSSDLCILCGAAPGSVSWWDWLKSTDLLGMSTQTWEPEGCCVYVQESSTELSKKIATRQGNSTLRCLFPWDAVHHETIHQLSHVETLWLCFCGNVRSRFSCEHCWRSSWTPPYHMLSCIFQRALQWLQHNVQSLYSALCLHCERAKREYAFSDNSFLCLQDV